LYTESKGWILIESDQYENLNLTKECEDGLKDIIKSEHGKTYEWERVKDKDEFKDRNNNGELF
jgi:hypothetical protein